LEYGGADAKIPMGKTNPEFAARIAQFSRRSSVEWITLVLHTTKEHMYTSQATQSSIKILYKIVSKFYFIL
jgi:hypothetical protein